MDTMEIMTLWPANSSSFFHSSWQIQFNAIMPVFHAHDDYMVRWTRWKWWPCDLQIRALSSIQVGKSNSMLLFPCSTHMMTTWSDVDSGKKLSLRTSQYIKILAPCCIMHLQPIPDQATAISPQYGAIQHGCTSIIKVMQGFFLIKWLTPRMDLKLTWEGLYWFERMIIW